MERLLAPVIDRVGQMLPAVGAALLLLIAGWAAAVVLRLVVMRIYGRFERLPQGRAVEDELRRGGLERPLSRIIGAVVFWGVLVFAATAATEALGLPVVTTWMAGVASLFPRVLVGLLVFMVGILAGAYAGRTIGRLASSMGLAYGQLLGRVIQVTLTLIALVIAVDQMGIQVDFLVAIATVLAASVSGAMALAFGLGAATAASNIIASHYVQQSFQAGQRIRLGDDEGRIREITPTAVILEAAGVRLHIPAKRFSETIVLQRLGGEST